LEKELLGFYVSGHPLDEYGTLPSSINQIIPDDMPGLEHRTPFRLCGVVSSLNKRFTRADNRPWANFTLSTRRHGYLMNMFSKAFEGTGATLEDNAIIGVHGFVSNRDGDMKLNVQEVFTLERRMPKLVQSITWFLKDNPDRQDFLKELRQALDDHPGECRMKLGFLDEGDTALVADTARSLSLHVTKETLHKLQNHSAVKGLEFEISPMPIFEKKHY
jgi:DNA polymerase-3 subunit alpha